MANYSTLQKKFKITALQMSAIFILPLFVFALVTKVKERKEHESHTDKIVSTQSSTQQNYMIKTVSQPVTHSETQPLGNSDSAK